MHCYSGLLVCCCFLAVKTVGLLCVCQVFVILVVVGWLLGPCMLGCWRGCWCDCCCWKIVWFLLLLGCWVLLVVVGCWVVGASLMVHWAGNGASAAPVLSLQPISCFDLLCFAPCFLFICRLICWLRNNYTVHIEKQRFHHLVPKVTAMLTPKISKCKNISSVHWLIALAAKIWK